MWLISPSTGAQTYEELLKSGKWYKMNRWAYLSEKQSNSSRMGGWSTQSHSKNPTDEKVGGLAAQLAEISIIVRKAAVAMENLETRKRSSRYTSPGP